MVAHLKSNLGGGGRRALGQMANSELWVLSELASVYPMSTSGLYTQTHTHYKNKVYIYIYMI